MLQQKYGPSFGPRKFPNSNQNPERRPQKQISQPQSTAFASSNEKHEGTSPLSSPLSGPRKPLHSLAAPGPERRGPHKYTSSRPKPNPERHGPHKQTSQPAAAYLNSNKVCNGPKIVAELPPSRPSRDAGKPHQQRAIRFTEAEVAKRLRKSPKTLRNWRSSGKGPDFMKLEGRILYRLVDVIAFEKKGWSGKSRKIIL